MRDKLLEQYATNKSIKLRNRIVMEYYPFVVSVARKCTMNIDLTRDLELQDFIHWGVIGLIQAIDSFDYKKGVKLITYAYPRVKGEMIDALRGMDWYGRHFRMQVQKLDRLKALGINDEKEIAKNMGLSVSKVRNIIRLSQQNIISGLTSYACNIPDILAINPLDVLLEKEQHNLLIREASKLPGHRFKIINYYYFKGMKTVQIAKWLGISASRVDQLKEDALFKLSKISILKDVIKTLDTLGGN